MKILIIDDIEGWVKYHQNNLKYLEIKNLEIDCCYSAREALNKIIENISTPYEVIFTDLQMENDFSPKLAGEWLIEQIKTFKQYVNSKIVIISASYNIEQIAKRNEVQYVPKSIVRHYDASIYAQFLN